MNDVVGNERLEVRVPAEAPWLGVGVECVIRPGLITLRDAASGAEARLSPDAFVGRDGRVLRFWIPVAHVIDFAGFRWDGRYEVACLDDATAESAAALILSMQAVPNTGREWSGEPLRSQRA